MNLAFLWQVCEILNPEITISGDYILNLKSLALFQTRCGDKHVGESDQSEEVYREQCLAGKQHLDPYKQTTSCLRVNVFTRSEDITSILVTHLSTSAAVDQHRSE